MNKIKRLLIITAGVLIWCQSPTIMATDDCSYRIIKVQRNDSLSVRFGPHRQYKKVTTIPYNGTGIQITGPKMKIGKSFWVPIEYRGKTGWANRGYLKKDCQVSDGPIAKDSNYHTVRRGETLYSIAKRYGYSYRQIAGWNNLQKPYGLSVGQRLRISSSPTTGTGSGDVKKKSNHHTCSFYHVVNVRANDVLWVRKWPNKTSKKLYAIPHNATQIQITGRGKKVGKSRWVPIKYHQMEGWVNRNYLEEDC